MDQAQLAGTEWSGSSGSERDVCVCVCVCVYVHKTIRHIYTYMIYFILTTVYNTVQYSTVQYYLLFLL